MNRPQSEESSSRPGSRRNSASAALSRRSSVKREKDRNSPHQTAPSSATSTPKKTAKTNLEFVVTGKQILKRSDRANSLPAATRRMSVDSISKSRKPVDSPRRLANVSQSSKSRETSMEDDMTLDLSQVSDFEDTNSKYGMRNMMALATSTPKPCKLRSCSLQNQLSQKDRPAIKSLDSSKQSRLMSLSYSLESAKTSSTSSPRYATEADYSSVSPEYSGQSSTDLSPTRGSQVLSPRSQDLQMSSCCVSTWQDCTEDCTLAPPLDGEWSDFWVNYNNSLSKVPLKQYYDQCPTPYRTETFDVADFELPDGPRKRSPDSLQAINNIICNEGLHLTPRETQNMIKCAHLLGNVLSKAIERRTKVNRETEHPEMLLKKSAMTLDLKETNIPVEVKEEKRCETATTQTDISLPNTKSAPKIFEKILRQLSKSSIDVEKIDNIEGNREKKE